MIDSRLPIILSQDGSYTCAVKKLNKLNLRNLGNLIREGFDLYVEEYLDDGSKADITRETLCKIAIGVDDTSRALHGKAETMEATLRSLDIIEGNDDLSLEVVYLIIRNGGMETFTDRWLRGMVINE